MRPPQVLDETERFVEREVISASQLSTVLRAFDKDLLRDVAIKVLPPDRSTDPSEVERFVEEARINGLLEHPGIVPVYEFGVDRRDRSFLCMKLVRGERFEKTLQDAGPSRLDPDKLTDFLQVFVKTCDAVAFAHSRGVIHRDIKTANVMLGDFGQVYLMDWGVARSSRAPDVTTVGGSLGESQPELPGTLIGTPCYMAPEQLVGLHDQVDHRTDVFGLGAMLYEILTGQPPRNTKNVVSTLRGVLTEIVPPENVVEGAVVPAELSRISLKAMAHKPLDRYQSVDDLKGDIERFLRGAWHLPKKYFDKGTVIVREGEMGGEAYIILEGRCAAVRNDEDGEVLLREMGPGEVFGEMAVLSNKARSASVRALTDVVLMVVSSEILSNALGLNFWMGSFVRTLVDRFREVDERLRFLEQNQRSRAVPPSR